MGTTHKRGERLEQDAVMSDYVAGLRARYGAYDRPIEEVRRVVDQALGNVRLTDVRYKMREEDD